MDPFKTLNLETETSILFMEELLSRGHEVLWAEVSDLVLRRNQLFARIKPVTQVSPIAFGKLEEVAVNDVDALLVRPDPPKTMM